MATFIERRDLPAPRAADQRLLKVAIKDAIDLLGSPTTAGSRVVARAARPALVDAACLAGIRAAEARGEVGIIGKTGLHELAFGVTGINPWFGTPVNPQDPSRIPGGSSSGSAVAVATGEADLALGTDTGGSIRIPAACCGVAGLKTTAGRIPTTGVWPLAPSLDTVGPLARDVAGLRAGMTLLEPGFPASSGAWAPVVARLRLSARDHIDAAIDRALRAAGIEIVDIDLPGWATADAAATVVLLAEAWAGVGHLVDAGLGDDVRSRLLEGARITPGQLARAQAVALDWRPTLRAVLERVGPLALPTLADDPPELEDAARTGRLRYTLPVNLAGFPALTLPVPGPVLSVGLQLVGLPGSETTLLAMGADIEAARGPGA